MIGCQRVSESGLTRVKFKKKHITRLETVPSSQLSSAKLLLIFMLQKDYHEKKVRSVKDLMCGEDGYEECVKLVLVHMIEEMYLDKDLELMKNSKRLDGFETNELFPSIRFVRYRFSASLDLTVISDEGIIFHFVSLVIDTMKDKRSTVRRTLTTSPSTSNFREWLEKDPLR